LANTLEFSKAQQQRKKVEAFVRGTEESDRIAPLAPAQTEVRVAAVLRSSWQPSLPNRKNVGDDFRRSAMEILQQ
jgi:hypothetical protein